MTSPRGVTRKCFALARWFFGMPEPRRRWPSLGPALDQLDAASFTARPELLPFVQRAHDAIWDLLHADALQTTELEREAKPCRR